MRSRLVTMAAATTSMVVVAFLVPLGLLVRTVAADRALHAAEVQARGLAPVLASVHDPQALADFVQSASASSSGHLSVFLPDGRVLGAAAVADANVELARTGRAFTTATADGAVVLVPVVIPDTGTAVVEMPVPGSHLRRGVATAWAIMAAAGAGLVLMAVVVADRIARGVVAPARALAVAAQRVAQGDLEARVQPDGPPEVAEVGRAFNILAARIGDLLTAEREAAADLSHRLRTPLTAIRLDVERLREGPVAELVAADVDALERAVSDVIHELRRHPREGVRPAADLASTTRERVAFWAALAEDQGRPYRVEVSPGIWPVAVNREDLEVVLDALLGNVLAHTPEKTPFRVAVEPAAGSRVRLVVEAEGPGLPAASIARGATGAGSTGLGLDIVRRAAQAAGGSLTLGSRPGGGARVEVEFGSPGAR